MSDIEIEIDGKTLKAKPNSMIIQVADEAGIYIPRFCYHKHLSIAANCRMCLVEVEKAPKPAPACATPIMPGMKVFTRSPKALAAQRAVMEFLLINHPLDCPICDQGGECELQDLSMGYGAADSFYSFGKRAVKDEDLGPLIASDMTRCIQCTRCVRFGDEVAGLRELGAIGRGEGMEISTYVQHAIKSDVSGNVIDICPVGALTSKPYRFTARAWELDQRPSIAAHDCVGSNINVHTRYGKVMRVVPRENNSINQTWISDRDRFSYQGIYQAERLAKPRIRIHNKWQETDWQTALEFAARGLHDIIQREGPENIGALASPNATLEEFYLLQKMMRSLGSQNIDHRLRQVDFSDQENMPNYLTTEIKIADLEHYDAILLIGSNIQKEQPILGLRVRKAALNGAKVMAINMVDYQFNFTMASRNIIAPHEFVTALAGVAKALVPEKSFSSELVITEIDQMIAENCRAGKKVAVLVGAQALNHPNAASIRKLASFIANACNGHLALLTEGANSAGAWLAGAVPGAGHLSAANMLENPRKGYLLLNIEPELDCANPVAAVTAIEKADCVVALSVFKNPTLERFAHVILPIATFTETSGTFVNMEGQWQGFQGVATPFEEARPAWKVLRVLGNFLHLDHFDYESSEAIAVELRARLTPTLQMHESDAEIMSADENNLNKSNKENSDLSNILLIKRKNVLSRIGEIPIYAGDSLVRHADALQKTQTIVEGDMSIARIHPETAERLHIRENEIVIIKQQANQVRLPISFDIRMPREGIFIAGATLVASGLSELFGEIEVQTS